MKLEEINMFTDCDSEIIVNLTPHKINIITKEGEGSISPSGVVARCKVEREQTGNIGNIPINRTKFGKVEGLPEPSKDTVYIVSTLIAQAVKGRTDIFIPDDIIRNEQGQITGCKALARL